MQNKLIKFSPPEFAEDLTFLQWRQSAKLLIRVTMNGTNIHLKTLEASTPHHRTTILPTTYPSVTVLHATSTAVSLPRLRSLRYTYIYTDIKNHFVKNCRFIHIVHAKVISPFYLPLNRYDPLHVE